MRLWRRLLGITGKNASPTWQDNRPDWSDGDRAARYMHIPEIDRWRAVPYDMPPDPERGAVLQRVRQLTESLDGALDEGSGATLDRLIESWVATWIATVEAEHTDHCAVINVHRGQTEQWLAKSTHTVRDEHEELDRIRGAYLACRARLADESMSSRPGWTAPHLLAGRGRAGRIAAWLLVGAWVLTDTLAFKNTLALALPQQSSTLTWLMSAGAASMTLVAAASVGVSFAIRRRGADVGSRLATILITLAWIGLGLAAVLVPLLGTGAHFAPLAALFFGAVYLISGACTIFGAERLYNPEYFAYVRLGKQYRQQQQRAADAAATVERARAAVDHHDGELAREDHRRRAAIVERQALGAEAANYARILMAGMLRDPAKTGLTETGPTPQLPVTLSEGTEAISLRDNLNPSGDGDQRPLPIYPASK